MISEESKNQLRRLMELRQARDEAKKALETAEAEYRDAEADAYEDLQEIEGSIPVNLGEPWGTVRFQGRRTVYARIIDPNAAQEHFEQRAMIDEVSRPKFVMSQLNSIARDCDEQGTECPPGLDYYTRKGVTITRQKS